MMSTFFLFLSAFLGFQNRKINTFIISFILSCDFKKWIRSMKHLNIYMNMVKLGFYNLYQTFYHVGTNPKANILYCKYNTLYCLTITSSSTQQQQYQQVVVQELTTREICVLYSPFSQSNLIHQRKKWEALLHSKLSVQSLAC